MKNINVSKLTSLLESKKNSNPNNISSISQSTNNPNNTSTSQSKQKHVFKVQSFPKEKFSLFEKKDFYHYDKKFHSDLPKVITPPISFHYPSSNENFCSFDMMTMMFELKKHQEILTDPRLNTKIHKDFLDNSLNLIFPENANVNINGNASKRIPNEKLKEDILKIIDSESKSREEIRKNESKDTKEKSRYTPSFYLRRSTLMSSTLSQKKKNTGIQVQSLNNARNIATSSKNNITGASLANLKKNIENSFEHVKKIKEGFAHPHKKNLLAKSVFSIFPYNEISDLKFNQIIFPNDPLVDMHVEEMDRSYVLPDQFILKKSNTQEKDNEVYSFYKEEKEEKVEKGTIKYPSKNDEDFHCVNLPANFFSYERDFLLSSGLKSEVFNRHLIIFNKNEKTANFVPVDSKFFLKKYKKVAPPVEFEDYEVGINNTNAYATLGRKRERDLIVIPKCPNESFIHNRNKFLNEMGVNDKEFVPVYVDIMWNNINVIREKIANSESNKMKVGGEGQNAYKEEEAIEGNEDEDEERLSKENVDLFGFSEAEDEEN